MRISINYHRIGVFKYKHSFRLKTGFYNYPCLISLFSIFCFFPYLRIIPTGTDSQPYALLISIILFLLLRITKLKKELFYLFLIAISGIAVSFIGTVDFNAVRSILNYISLFFIATVTYYLYEKYRIMPYKYFKLVVYVWFFFGLVQMFIPSFGSFLIPRASGVGVYGRGTISLAPEPTFYAIICCCLLIVNYLNYRNLKDFKLIQGLLLFQIALLSRSATILFILMLSYGLYLLTVTLRKKPQKIFYYIVAIYLLVIVAQHVVVYIESSRFGKLFSSLLDDPLLFVIVDESVNERFIHAFFPIKGFFDNFGIPHSYNNFNEYMSQIYDDGSYNQYIPFYKSGYSRIMSGFGSLLFELGIFGLLLIVVLVNCTIKIGKRNKHFFFYGILFFLILFNAMPFTNAMIGYVIGNLIYRKYHPLTDAKLQTYKKHEYSS